MIGRYETTLPCTSQFPLTLPRLRPIAAMGPSLQVGLSRVGGAEAAGLQARNPSDDADAADGMRRFAVGGSGGGGI